MKKGFTLIELLAVIVILAIIAVIAVPQILGVIEKTRKGAAESSALGYIDAVEKQMLINELATDKTKITSGVYDVPMASTSGVSVKGQAPTSGWLEIVNNKVERYSFVIGQYVISYDGTDKTAVKGDT
ncbi:MAG: prepilin-type N-terminal cleavage/methylation domain-containing protein, partial [Bacilli bacterium]|nr:prepilin-type N-terminal cleavage/methylation domain-containing protein [Bacilli bacterium]